MNDLVFLQHRQALTTSLKVAEYFEKRHDLSGKEKLETALANAKATYPLRMDLEIEQNETNLNYISWCLQDISESFFQMEDLNTAIYTVLDAFKEILNYMTPNELKTFHVLVNMARDGIIAGYLKPSVASESKATAQKCAYIIEMPNHSVKIGITSDFNRKLSEISRGSGMEPSNWCYTDYISCKQAQKIEGTLHHVFNNYRLNGEFFKISYADACAELVKYTRIKQHSREDKPCNL